MPVYYRSTKNQQSYDEEMSRHRGDAGNCPLCDDGQRGETVEETKLFRVAKNNFPYEIFDGRNVEDHLMIIPKRHVKNLYEYTTDEKMEFMKLATKYDSLGYSLFARADVNPTKTVSHQHAHLIKTGSKIVAGMRFRDNPYVLDIEYRTK
jgi:diadenosine tetraphosphate (Ap4A) HIT family hydrolase